MTDNGNATSGAQKGKRQKIPLACTPCRLRKVRCDGDRPVCRPCTRRRDKRISCEYADSSDDRPTFGDSNPGLDEYRLSPSPETHQNQQSLPGQPGVDRRGSANSAGALQQHSNNYAFPVDETPQSCESNHGIESMTGAAGAPGAAFFGSSSASVFMEQVRAAINARVAGCATIPESNASARVVSTPGENRGTSQRTCEYFNYDLPSRRNADSLVARYWQVIHPLYPFLHRQKFNKSYNHVWTGAPVEGDERAYLCLLNSIFALSSSITDSIPIKERISTSKVYFQRARDLLSLSLWEPGSIETVQCLLIMAQYLQSTNNVHQCWMAVGQAVRIAQELGLHLAGPSWPGINQQERELSRRIWHGCILMDRLVAMTLGRPAMVSKSVAEAGPYPSIIDDESLLDDSNIAPTQPPVLAFYVKTLELYAIVDDVLTTLYMQNDAIRRPRTKSQRADLENTDMTTVVRLDKTLTDWAKSLPPHLRPSRSESLSNDTIRRQSIVCRARLLHAKILLFRPALSLFCLSETHSDEADSEESLHQWMILRCSILCLRAAHELIDLIFTNFPRDGSTGPLPSWWYNTFYVYTAATVLLASRLHPRLHDLDSGYVIAVSWSHAMEILRAIAPMSESAQKCAIALEILSTTITLAAEGEPQSSFQNNNHTQQPDVSIASPGAALNELAGFGEADDLPGFNDLLLDLSDMSWLNSIPAHLG